MDEARATAARAAECDPAAVAAAKRALHFGASSTLAEAMENERSRSSALRARRSRP